MTTARSAIAPLGSAGYYHCVSRCVRRAWLCGTDRLSGKSYDHRRAWVVTRVTELASIFGVRVLAYAAMSNHLHLALEFDPAWVEDWTDGECLERWLRLYCPADYSEQQRANRLTAWLGQPERIAQIRVRLASVSEFMKCLNEHIARIANLEDGCTGRLWEGRFKCLCPRDAFLKMLAAWRRRQRRQGRSLIRRSGSVMLRAAFAATSSPFYCDCIYHLDPFSRPGFEQRSSTGGKAIECSPHKPTQGRRRPRLKKHHGYLRVASNWTTISRLVSRNRRDEPSRLPQGRMCACDRIVDRAPGAGR